MAGLVCRYMSIDWIPAFAGMTLCGPEPFVINNARSAVDERSQCKEPFVEQWPFIAAAMCEAGGFSNVSKQAMIIRLQDLGLLINKTSTEMNWQVLCLNV